MYIIFVDIQPDIIVLELSIVFCMTCDCVTDVWQFVTVIYNVTLTLNPKFKNKKINKNKNK